MCLRWEVGIVGDRAAAQSQPRCRGGKPWVSPEIDPNDCKFAKGRPASLPSSYIVQNKLFVRCLSAGAAPTGIVMTDCRSTPQSLAGDTVAYPASGELEDTTKVVAGRPVWDVLRRLEYQLSHQRCAALQMPNTRPSGELLGVLKGAWSFRKIPSGGKRRIDDHLERRAVSPPWLGLVTTRMRLDTLSRRVLS